MVRLTGRAGSADRMANLAEKPACLATWLIHAPGQSPAWSYYMLTIVHLRPLDGVPANISEPGSSHELMLVALESGEHHPRHLQSPPNKDDWDSIRMLRPFNAVVQFYVGDGNDDAAVTLGEKCVQAICDGRMPAEPPVSGWRGWQECVVATAEHIRTGGHHE